MCNHKHIWVSGEDGRDRTCALVVLVDGALLQLDRFATQLLFSPREGAIAPPAKMCNVSMIVVMLILFLFSSWFFHYMDYGANKCWWENLFDLPFKYFDVITC